MAFTLSDLLQGAYRKLGQTETFSATGGSTSTAIDTKFKEKFQDDTLTDFTLFVAKDAGGAGAAPEGEFSVITIYVESTNTITISPSVTVAIAAGDRITLASNIYPLQEMIQLANDTLVELGPIILPYTTLSTVAAQTEYSIPVAQKRQVVRVQVATRSDTDDNQWKDLATGSWEVMPNTAGSVDLLILRDELDAGWTLKVWYKADHPYVETYDDVILEHIHPTVAVAGLRVKALEWLNSKISGSEDFYIDSLNDARREFDIAQIKHPIPRMKKKNRGLYIGSYD